MDTLLRHLCRLTGGPVESPALDGELLGRFVAHRDEAAFAALVRRHGPMVQGVCCSVLHNWHDAEDAFQATFLVLARKAASIRRQQSLGSWLHAVAYHLAVKALARASRRRTHERRVADMPADDPVLDMTVRDLQRVLHEELGRLDDKHLAPLALCYLEGKTCAEAARQLGWSKGTVRGRLHRGRALLRGRLTRRGLALSAGLFTTAFTQSRAEVTARSVDALARAALHATAKGALEGVVAGEIVALVEGVCKSMSLTRFKAATVLLLTLGLGLMGLGVVAHGALGAKSAGADRQEAAKPDKPEKANLPATAEQTRPADDARAVSGQVLDPKGKPLAGARIYLGGDRSAASPPSVRATTGRDGRFRFVLSKEEIDKTKLDLTRLPVLAVADGLGAEWTIAAPAGQGTDVKLRLTEDVSINGRIVDQEGRPVRGAEIRVLHVADYSAKGLTHYLNELRSAELFVSSTKQWDGPVPCQPKIVLGADGRFRLHGLGRDRIVGLRLTGPTIEHVTLYVMARPAEPVTATNPHIRLRVYGATFTHVAAPSRPIRGLVRDKATGKPLAGVAVTGWTGSYIVSPTRTGPNGRYELWGCAKSPRYAVQAQPAEGQLYFQCTQFPNDTPGLAPLPCDFELIRGLVVRGRVTDQATGKPVGGAVVRYNPLLPNPHVQAGLFPLPETNTAPDGTYRMVVLPGPGVLQVIAFGHDYQSARVTSQEMAEFFKDGQRRGNADSIQILYGVGQVSEMSQEGCHALVLLNSDGNSDTLTRDVVLLPGRTVEGTVVDPDAKPLAGVTAHGLAPNQFGPTTLATAAFTVRALHPQRSRRLLFIQEEKRLGKLLEVRGDEQKPLTVRLQPCGSVTGRIVDKEGLPLAGLVVEFYPERFYGHADRKATTDRDGRFRVDGLLAGERYGSTRKNDINFFPLYRSVVVKPGEVKALGDAKPHDEQP
jgi:RNA polymerase sigma factor (sigma-70 family)